MRNSLIVLALFLLASCAPAPAGSVQAAAVGGAAVTQTPAPTRTPSPIIVPTIDQALVARITASWVELTEAQAEQARIAAQAADLDYRLTASAATLTASVPTSTAAAMGLVYAGATRAQQTAVIETASARGTASAERVTAQRRAGTVWSGFAFLAWALGAGALIAIIQGRRKKRLEIRLLENELEYQRQELEEPSDQLTIYHGEPGNVDRAAFTSLPCSVTEMSTVARWVVQMGDVSLAVNKWESRGLSGRIDEVRDWFLSQGYADQDANKVVTVNEEGAGFLSAWLATHATPTLPARLSGSGPVRA
jgi:hypothetical protein